MSLFDQIVGGFVIITLCCAVLAALWSGVCHVTKLMLQDVIRDAREVQKDWIADEMAQNAWWFSEDQATCLAFQAYAHSIKIRYHNISSIREQWRQAVKEGRRSINEPVIQESESI